MTAEIEVAAVVNALDLLPAERELVLDVERRLWRNAPARSRRAGATAAWPGRAPGSGATPSATPASARTTPHRCPACTKNCISICSNSRVRKMKFPGVISLRNAFPIWAMPNGISLPDDLEHVEVVDVDPLRRLRPQVDHAADSSTGPMKVLNIRLNIRGSVSEPRVPHTGHCASGWPGVPLIRGIVGPKAVLALPAIHQRIGEPRHVPRRLPDPRMHEDRRIQPLDVVPGVDHGAATSGP